MRSVGGRKHRATETSALRSPGSLHFPANRLRLESIWHWSIDVAYDEEGLKPRNRLGTENTAWLRRLTSYMLKQHRGKMGTVIKRKSCGGI